VEVEAGQHERGVQESVCKYGIHLRQCWYPVSDGKYRHLKYRITLP